MNKNQIYATTTVDGALQIIDDRGSDKGLVLVLRAILLTCCAKPNEIIMSTFAEKAAFEPRDRLHQFAIKSGYKGPIYESCVLVLYRQRKKKKEDKFLPVLLVLIGK